MYLNIYIHVAGSELKYMVCARGNHVYTISWNTGRLGSKIVPKNTLDNTHVLTISRTKFLRQKGCGGVHKPENTIGSVLEYVAHRGGTPTYFMVYGLVWAARQLPF